MAWIVVDSAFNEANYPRLVGQVYEEPPSYAQVKQVVGKAYFWPYLTNWQYGGYSYVEESTTKPPRLWTRGFADYVAPENVIRIAREQGIDRIFLAGGFWSRLGRKGYGERVSISEAEMLLREAQRVAIPPGRAFRL